MISVRLNLSMFSIQLKAAFSLCSLISLCVHRPAVTFSQLLWTWTWHEVRGGWERHLAWKVWTVLNLPAPWAFWEIIKAGQKVIGQRENFNAVHPGSGI